MDVASPLRAGIAVEPQGSLRSAAPFEWQTMATKFFAVIGDRPVCPRGHDDPMALGEGASR